jgi:predicted  nucleic acid-binding Zn-ribbon protein
MTGRWAHPAILLSWLEPALTTLAQSKFMALQTNHNTTTTSLQRELDKLRQEFQAVKVQLRDLEMGNDDLERNERAISSSLQDMEARYSKVLEEKILQEHELLQKANLEEEMQRLKDELRGDWPKSIIEEVVLIPSQMPMKRTLL